MSIQIDVERLKAASGWGRYRYKNARTRYGMLNVPCGEEGLLGFRFCPDSNGDVSVNVGQRPRDLTKESISWEHDYRGFVISRRTGHARKLSTGNRNAWERKNPRKTENWGAYAQYLLDYMESFE